MAQNHSGGAANSDYHFSAFISYSHAADDKLAPALQYALQRFAKPWYRMRSLRIFRDETSLSVTPELWPTIQSAVDQSRHFVLLASPDSAKSKWVNQEVTHWLQSKGSDRLLIVLTAGEIRWDDASRDFDWSRTDALPPALRSAFSTEPKFEDLRDVQDVEHISDKNPILEKVTASLFSRITGRPLDDVVGQHVREHRRTKRLAAGAIAILFALFLSASGAGWIAMVQRDRAERALAEGTEMANGMVSEIAQRFRGRKDVQQSLVIEILDRARQLADNLTDLGGQSPALKQGKAAALAELSDALMSIHEKTEARKNANIALGLFAELAAGEPDNVEYQRNLAAAEVRLGDIELADKKADQANAHFERAMAILSRLPADAATRRQLAVGHERLAAQLIEAQHLDAAIEHLRQCVRIRQDLAGGRGHTDEDRIGLSACHGKIGHALWAKSDSSGAIAAFREGLALIQGIDPIRLEQHLEWRRELATTHQELGNALLKTGEAAAALEHFRLDLQITQKIYLSDQQRIDWADDLIKSYERVADASLELHDGRGALAAFRHALDLAKSIHATRKADAHWLELLMKMYSNTALLHLQLLEPHRSLELSEECLAVFREAARNSEGQKENLILALQNVSWHALFARDFNRALAVADAALALGPDRVELQLNRAHALLFSGRIDDATQLYLANKGKSLPDPGSAGNKAWEMQAAADFSAFRAAGLDRPSLGDVEASLQAAPP
jgi:tetratricopeptide (TPR) repeat protein